MLDPKLLRADLEATAERLARRGYQLDTEAFAALEAPETLINELRIWRSKSQI